MRQHQLHHSTIHIPEPASSCSQTCSSSNGAETSLASDAFVPHIVDDAVIFEDSGYWHAQDGQNVEASLLWYLSAKGIDSSCPRTVSTIVSLMDTIITSEKAQTPDSLKVVARAAVRIGTGVVKKTVPQVVLPEIKKFLIKAIQHLISQIKTADDERILKDVMTLLGCLGVELGGSDEALELFDSDLMDRTIYPMNDTSRLKLFPTVVDGMSPWLLRSKDFQTQAAILQTLIQIFLNCAAVSNYNTAQHCTDLFLSRCEDPAYRPFGSRVLQRLAYAVQEKHDEEEDAHAFWLLCRLFQSVETVSSAGWNFATPELSPAWKSALHCGARIVSASFPLADNDVIKPTNFTDCKTCNNALLESAQRSAVHNLTVNEVEDIRYWRTKVAKVRTLFLVVSDEETRKTILGARYHLKLSQMMGWTDPLIHRHTVESHRRPPPVDTPTSHSQALLVPPVVDPIPTQPHPTPSADAPQPRRALSHKGQFALKASTLSVVAEVDAGEEEDVVQLPGPPTTSIQAPSHPRPRPSISLPSTPAPAKRPQSSEGVLSPLLPNRGPSAQFSSNEMVKSPPFAYRGIHTQSKPAAPKSGTQNSKMIRSPTNAKGLKRGVTESLEPEEKENSRQVKKARTDMASSSTVKPVRKRAASAGPSSATSHGANPSRSHNRARSATGIPQPTHLDSRPAHHLPSVPQPSSIPLLGAAIALQDEQVFRSAPLGSLDHRFEDIYDFSDSSSEPSEEVPCDASNRPLKKLMQNLTAPIRRLATMSQSNHRYQSFVAPVTTSHAPNTERDFAQDPRATEPMGDMSTGAEDWEDSQGAQPGPSNLTSQTTTDPAPVNVENAQAATHNTTENGADSNLTRRRSHRQPKPVRSGIPNFIGIRSSFRPTPTHICYHYSNIIIVIVTLVSCIATEHCHPDPAMSVWKGESWSDNRPLSIIRVVGLLAHWHSDSGVWSTEEGGYEIEIPANSQTDQAWSGLKHQIQSLNPVYLFLEGLRRMDDSDVSIEAAISEIHKPIKRLKSSHQLALSCASPNATAIFLNLVFMDPR
ncbi:hypothetical protein SISNIDRAFT_463595 [Sistotremastrum niveocremeum HHB9708]|uniref:Uncharacterized protein n=1 Tax=Sistotremastrum niveocremeum HHB9708 TaxID=1314777 RepID=A0A164YEY5_9AGAM|nr:hypothetical protein SISNIDRAFT_463595 [Sistotremastrum niveocremeum HHB9708]